MSAPGYGRDQRLVDHALISRVLEPRSLAVAGWLARTDVSEAAGALRRGTAPEAVQQLAASRLPDADPEADLEAGARVGARLVTPDDDEWPHFAFACLHAAQTARLAGSSPAEDEKLADSEPTVPVALWVRGPDRLAEAAVRSAALVGSRASTAYGEHVATELSRDLAERDVTVVSGGAYGIDGCAHRAAIASGGRTWLVSAGGIERPYPQRHAPLYERVASEGLVVTEYPPGARPLRHRFLMRNRLIAALSSATVIVEAAARSGALSTARHARALGRPLLAVPGPITSTMSVGCHEQLRGTGTDDPLTRAQICTGVDDVMAHVDGSLPDRVTTGGDDLRRALDRLPPLARRVFDGLPRRGWADEVTVAGRAGVTALEVARALPTLVVEGLVESSYDGHRVAKDVLR
ncbi:DNA-processing protein DprA [Jatrophihabitans sp. YIM 134969]